MLDEAVWEPHRLRAPSFAARVVRPPASGSTTLREEAGLRANDRREEQERLVTR